LQAQEELLAGVARSAAKGDHRPVELAAPTAYAEAVEEYERSMTPPLLDIRKLAAEEREIDIVTAAEDRRNLVSA
jgi:hypothetical protein